MGAGTLISLGSSLLGSATDIYFDYNNKKNKESSIRIDSALKLAELNQSVEAKNFNNRSKITELRFKNSNAREEFAMSERENDIKSQAGLNAIKSKYATSGVELRYSALDYINAVEDSVSRERAIRTSINENQIASQERMVTSLLFDIDRNNILKEFEREKIKMNKNIVTDRLNDHFLQSSISSILSFGNKSSKRLAGDK